MPHFKRFLHDKARLRHGTFGRVDKHQNAVDHHHYALHLARKIRMSRGVDYVYFYALIVYGRIFCENGYSPFALQIVRVHYPFLNGLVVAEGMALF